MPSRKRLRIYENRDNEGEEIKQIGVRSSNHQLDTFLPTGRQICCEALPAITYEQLQMRAIM
jgi:hypothetical protein